MGRSSAVLYCVALTGLIAVADPGVAVAGSQTYEYRIMHPIYGDIGTYTNVVEKSGDATEVKSALHVEVKILGAVMYSEAAERSEHWQGGRLLSFHGVTVTNDQQIEVRGEARGSGFVITSPAGTVVGPASVHPSNPWSSTVLNTDWMMSSKTGELYKVRVSGGAIDNAMLDGKAPPLRRYRVDSDTRQFVWMDDRGVPIAFRTEEGDTAIDFLLIRYPSGEPAPWSTLPPEDDATASVSLFPQAEAHMPRVSYEH